MAERKATNKYIPPDFDPRKHGSINRYRHSHPLRERARKLDSEGILIIRFEMPYNAWCDNCKIMVPKGRRFNAEKKVVGHYFSTKILSFTMKCTNCENHYEIRTDPKNTEYECVSGITRKVEDWELDPGDAAPLVYDAKESARIRADPMAFLEMQAIDKEKALSNTPSFQRLFERQSIMEDDFALLSAARRKFRDRKKFEHEKDRDILSKYPFLSVPLKEKVSEDDVEVVSFREEQRERVLVPASAVARSISERRRRARLSNTFSSAKRNSVKVKPGR